MEIFGVHIFIYVSIICCSIGAYLFGFGLKKWNNEKSKLYSALAYSLRGMSVFLVFSGVLIFILSLL